MLKELGNMYIVHNRIHKKSKNWLLRSQLPWSHDHRSLRVTTAGRIFELDVMWKTSWSTNKMCTIKCILVAHINTNMIIDCSSHNITCTNMIDFHQLCIGWHHYLGVGCELYQTVICAFCQLKCVAPWLTAWLNREVKHLVPLAHRSDLFKCEWGLQFVPLCTAIGLVPRRCMYILSEYYCIRICCMLVIK